SGGPHRDPCGRRSTASMIGLEVRLRIRAYIEANLKDPELSPGSIARANFVSTRYLHKLFENQGTTVCRCIGELRLDRCRRDLDDPQLCREPVIDIAARWGFRSASHFSRRFRATYGCTPREFRKRQLLAAEPRPGPVPFAEASSRSTAFRSAVSSKR